MNIRFALVSSLLIIAGAPAFAEDEAALQRTVRFGDLNLAAAAGQAQLKVRLDGAVRAVCPIEQFSGLEGALRRRACVKTAHDSFEAQTSRAIAQASPPTQQIADARPTQ